MTIPIPPIPPLPASPDSEQLLAWYSATREVLRPLRGEQRWAAALALVATVEELMADQTLPGDPDRLLLCSTAVGLVVVAANGAHGSGQAGAARRALVAAWCGHARAYLKMHGINY